MADPWANDPVVGTAPSAAPVVAAQPAPVGAAPWESDPVVGDAGASTAPGGYQPSAIPWLDGVNAFANSAVNAIPVVGPALTSAGHTVDAAFNNMLGFPAETPQDRANIDTAEQAHFPIASTAGTVAGTVAPMVVAGGLPGLGGVLGTTGNLGSRAMAGLVSGGVIGGADATARGQTPQDAVHTALVDAAMGGAAPVAFAGIGAGWRAMTGQPVLASAPQTLARALADDKVDPATINARLAALGPDAVVADLGPNLQGQAGALAALPGKAKATIVDALMARNSARNQRIIGAVNDTLGPAPIPSRIEAGLAANRAALGPDYTRALQGASAVDSQPIADNLDSLAVNLRGDAQKAVQRVRGMLDVPGNPGNLDPYPGALLETRHAIDDMLAKATPGTNEWGQLTAVRRQIDQTLTSAVPGIKDVDARYAELARQSGALTQGQQLLDSGRTAIRPAELADMIGQGALPQGTMVGPSAVPMRLAQGARAEIDRIVGTTANDLNALKTALKGDGSWNRDRLAQLYGPEKTDRLLGLLDTEKTYDETANTVLRNSMTASRIAGQREMSTDAGGIPQNASMTGLVLHALTKGANAGLAFNKGNTNSKIAEALMGQNVSPQDSDILAALIKRQAKPALIAPAAVPLLENRAGGQ